MSVYFAARMAAERAHLARIRAYYAKNVEERFRTVERAYDSFGCFRAISATALDLPDASFSRVLAIDCADMFAPREAFFAEAFRVLRPGGILAPADVVAGAAPVGPFQRALVRGQMRFWNIHAANYYGVDGYRSRVLAAGFRDVRFESIGHHVFPGAVACTLGDAHRAHSRVVHGRIRTAIDQVVFRLIARAYRQQLVDYTIVVARKSCGELRAAAVQRAKSGEVQSEWIRRPSYTR